MTTIFDVFADAWHYGAMRLTWVYFALASLPFTEFHWTLRTNASRLPDLPPKEKQATFAYLANIRPEAAHRDGSPRWCLNLLKETISTLKQYAITDYDAISSLDVPCLFAF